ncbi:SAM-dependent methyltransferase [Novosphingobium gossypii]|uniref:SAM-dependent methyltransferase n=1 Tax=Novosphingobium gossypii TaxID=1604774 RepID=UPI003D1D9564
MHYSLVTVGRPPWPVVSLGDALRGEDAEVDPRWPALVSHLRSLHEAGRRAIRIVDVNCGDGALLIHAVREARALGFLAVEGLGADSNGAAIKEARWRSHLLHDTGIGIEFEVAEPLVQLEVEAEFPVDIVLYHVPLQRSDRLQSAVVRAARLALAKGVRSQGRLG